MWTNSRLLAQGSRWLAQGSRQRKEKKQVQKVSRKEKWKVWKSICMCLQDQNRMTHSMFVFPTWKYGEAGTAKTPIYPIAQLDALKFAPTSTVSPSKTTAARDAEWTSTSSASDRGGDRCSWLLYRLKQHEQRTNVNMTFLAARSAGCPRTMDTGHRIVQRRVRRIETRGTESRRGEGGWQAFSKLRKREVKIYWHTHTTRSHTLIQITLCAMKTCLQTFMCECVEDLNKAICNEDMLANR